MAHLLVASAGFPSILFPSLELARRLAKDGHRVTFASWTGNRGQVEHLGLDFLELEKSRYQESLDADARRGIFERLWKQDQRRLQAALSMGVESWARSLEELSPDLVLIDGEMHEQIIVASGQGRPLALLNSFVSIWRRPGLPPPHCLVEPGVGWRGSVMGISLLWLALRLRKRARAGRQRARYLGCDRLSVLRSLARHHGLDLGREVDASQWLIPFTYRNLPVLSLHASEFEFAHRPPARVRYVGPMVLHSRLDRPMSDADRAELEELLSRQRGCQEERLIYATFGSLLSSEIGFLKRLCRIVEGRPDWELVISLSGRLERRALGPLPDRVHVFDWVPQLEILERADLVVTHGGIHSLDEAILNGIPLLVYCGHETDMAGNTARVVHHGLGIAGDSQRDDVGQIRDHVDHLAGEERFRTQLRRMRSYYLAYAENRVAERAVRQMLDGAESHPTAERGAR